MGVHGPLLSHTAGLVVCFLVLHMLVNGWGHRSVVSCPFWGGTPPHPSCPLAYRFQAWFLVLLRVGAGWMLWGKGTLASRVEIRPRLDADCKGLFKQLELQDLRTIRRVCPCHEAACEGVTLCESMCSGSVLCL